MGPVPLVGCAELLQPPPTIRAGRSSHRTVSAMPRSTTRVPCRNFPILYLAKVAASRGIRFTTRRVKPRSVRG